MEDGRWKMEDGRWKMEHSKAMVPLRRGRLSPAERVVHKSRQDSGDAGRSRGRSLEAIVEFDAVSIREPIWPAERTIWRLLRQILSPSR